jgi:hypothetical protein
MQLEHLSWKRLGKIKDAPPILHMKSMIIPGTFAHKSQYIYWGTDC